MKIKAAVAAVITAGILLGGCSSEPQSTKDCVQQAQTVDGSLDCIQKDMDKRMSSAPAMPTAIEDMDKPVATSEPVETKTEAPVAPKKAVDWSAGAPKDWQDQIDVFGIHNDCKSIESAIMSLPQKDMDIQSLIVEQSKIYGCRK